MPEATSDPAPPQTEWPAPTDRPAYVDALGTIACVWLALITVGFAGFRFLGPALPTGASRNADRTFFTSVNAVTSTGFEQSFAAVRDFPTTGRVLLATLALGGALVTLASALYFARAIFARASSSKGFWIAVGVFGLVPAILGAITNGFDGVHAATRLGLISQYGTLTTGARVWLVALAAPAVVGPAVWLAWRGRDSALRVTVITAVAIYLLSTLCLASMVVDWGRSGSSGMLTNRAAQAVNAASVLNVNASTGLGLNAAWPSDLRAGAGPWALLLLMAIGTVPGGLGAGIGLLSIVLVVRQAVRSFRGGITPSPRDARLAGVAVLSIAAWFAIVAGAMLVLAATQPATPGDRLLFIVVSAASNVGLSHDPIGLTGGGLFTLALTMLLGRLLPMATLCAMAVVATRTPEDRDTHDA